jgi:hypothetical protein
MMALPKGSTMWTNTLPFGVTYVLYEGSDLSSSKRRHLFDYHSSLLLT